MKSAAFLVVALVALDLSSAFIAPQVQVNHGVQPLQMAAGPVSRRDLISNIATISVAGVMTTGAAAFAEEAVAPAAAPPKPDMGPVPTDFKVKGEYYPDAILLVKNMRYATLMDKGTPNMEQIGKSVRKQMVDFVAQYRRNNKVNGRLSYSTLYTSINVLAGHYASYGPKFPVPEKRRKRLLQEYNDIEKNMRKNR
eukprot:CAMPEP_0113936178 /NCGR_PEP_ID=MMETSP1339-20121228/3148_1 /TAXON_ID=94617 /ORGANISM="Fibrocapsa japonica" /LENGTH=195 /DNA_ID=CAMNT_0000938557 /DNA_START=71 /DNA_END=658 /DNA_ORIENTATION=- /assembly_acc=CAM_ASM_000762